MAEDFSFGKVLTPPCVCPGFCLYTYTNKKIHSSSFSNGSKYIKYFYFLFQMREYQDFGQFHFHWADYVVFVLMIVLSTGTGVYYGYFRYTASHLSYIFFWYIDPNFYRKEKVGKKIPHIDVEATKAKRTTDFGSSKMNEYLLGSRKLKIFPVAMSLVGR